jgi:hypothetical protein
MPDQPAFIGGEVVDTTDYTGDQAVNLYTNLYMWANVVAMFTNCCLMYPPTWYKETSAPLEVQDGRLVQTWRMYDKSIMTDFGDDNRGRDLLSNPV